MADADRPTVVATAPQLLCAAAGDVVVVHMLEGGEALLRLPTAAEFLALWGVQVPSRADAAMAERIVAPHIQRRDGIHG
ncbi:hypothetical protein [Actinomadura rubrisoli]|uniref:Uncharacterized protein n=1 Tax=Actinomadura rubrisoli TaxID=2530368 RepID=A0A4R5CJL3_9ACTN|nr:hypothetical protein [Actinomadura rubrisoli]TDD97602.1 hypothetical protein E1298_00805 [Actinomadura rubrisoli]